MDFSSFFNPPAHWVNIEFERFVPKTGLQSVLQGLNSPVSLALFFAQKCFIPL